MFEDILKPIEQDMALYRDLMEKELAYIIKRTGESTLFEQWMVEQWMIEQWLIEKALRPALVILSSRIYGGNQDKTTVLAVVMQFLYIADTIHSCVTDDSRGFAAKVDRLPIEDRLLILSGDYIYSRAAVIMLESSIKGMLQPMADIVCQMQEGRVERSNLSGYNPEAKVMHNIIRKETGELFAGCCKLGASLAGATKEEQENMSAFGRNLGTAYGLLKAAAPIDQVAFYADKGQKALLSTPAKPEKAILEQLLQLITCGGMSLQRLVG